MSSKKPTEPWRAEPHTLAKIAILKTYLESWFSIFGISRKGQDVLYIDGFAGPGIYAEGENGSPVEALIASAKISGSPLWKGGKINCAFIESNRSIFSILKERIAPFLSNSKLSIKVYNNTFIEGFNTLKMDLPQFFSSELPLFAFIDPFGPSGAPFSIVKEILSSPTSEVLINFDSDGLARIYKLYTSGKDNGSAENILNLAFGDKSWQSVPVAELSKHSFKNIAPLMMELYKEKLFQLPNVKYVFPFEMRDKNDQHSYYLIFASQHHLGLEKMKVAMKKIDQTGDYRFSDARVDQEVLFKYDDVTETARLLYEHFLERKVLWEEIRLYTLNHTPFVNPKSMLSILEKKDVIKVYPENPKRRKGTFPDGTVKSIEFLS